MDLVRFCWRRQLKRLLLAIADRANRSAGWALRFGLSFCSLQPIFAKFGWERAIPLVVMVNVSVDWVCSLFFATGQSWRERYQSTFVLFLSTYIYIQKDTKDPSISEPIQIKICLQQTSRDLGYLILRMKLWFNEVRMSGWKCCRWIPHSLCIPTSQQIAA